MKQVCPECLKSVDVPDSAAGSDFPCPVCGSKIAVPKNYTPSVASPPPPPPLPVDRPPPPPGLQVPSTTTPSVTPPPVYSGAGDEIGITLSSRIVDWIAPVCLSLAFALTFFNWVGSYPGGHRLFAQSAWDGLSGSISPNMVPTELEEAEKKLESLTTWDWPLLPYVILLIIAAMLAWAERFVHEIHPARSPGFVLWLTNIWPRRFQILTVLSFLLLALVVAQWWRGFGLERAVKQYAVQKYEDEAKAADTQAKKTAVQVKAGQEAARFAVQGTLFYTLAFVAHLLAALALLIRVWLTNREGKPFPRFVLRY